MSPEVQRVTEGQPFAAMASWPPLHSSRGFLTRPVLVTWNELEGARGWRCERCGICSYGGILIISMIILQVWLWLWLGLWDNGSWPQAKLCPPAWWLYWGISPAPHCLSRRKFAAGIFEWHCSHQQLTTVWYFSFECALAQFSDVMRCWCAGRVGWRVLILGSGFVFSAESCLCSTCTRWSQEGTTLSRRRCDSFRFFSCFLQIVSPTSIW